MFLTDPILIAGLLLVLFLYYAFIIKNLQHILILLASAAFYLYFFGRAFWILLVIAVVFYATGFLLSGGPEKRKKVFLILSVFGVILIFLWLRYWDYLFAFLARQFFLPVKIKNSILLPVGLSFFIFKGLSYLIDVYRNQTVPVKNPFHLLLYLFYFPQVTAGPIQRWISFRDNLKTIKRFDFDHLYRGFTLILFGVFKKMVVADRIAFYVNEVFASPEQKGLHLVLAAYFYAFQIYADFSGYTDIANGLSRVFGHAEVKNFAFPYFTRSISEFWQKWHITLSSWLRDYLFLPISFAVSRRLRRSSYLGLNTDILIYASATTITMAIAGFWHGASWTFVCWGLIFGFYMGVGHASRKARARLRKLLFAKHRIPKNGVSMFINFSLVTFAWIFFRSPSLADAMKFLGSIELTLPRFASGQVIFNLILAGTLVTVDLLAKNPPKPIARIPLVLKAVILALAACLIIIFSIDSANEFIYFRF